MPPTMEKFMQLFGFKSNLTTGTTQLLENLKDEHRILTEDLQRCDVKLQENTKKYEELEQLIKENRDTHKQLLESRAQKQEECEQKKEELQYAQK